MKIVTSIARKMERMNYQMFDYLRGTSDKKIMSTILSVALLIVLFLFSQNIINIWYTTRIVFVVLLLLVVTAIFAAK